MSLLAAARGGISRFFFSLMAPLRLGVARFVFFTSALIFTRTTTHQLASLPDLFWAPSGIFHFLPWLRPPLAIPTWLDALWAISVVAAALGLFSRVSLWAALLLTSFYSGYDNCFGLVSADFALGAVIQLAFAMSRAGDAFSIDAWLRARKGFAPDPSAEYLWPLRFGQLYLALAWFGTGFQKVRAQGFAWITDDHLSRMLTLVGTDLGKAMAEYTLLCRAGSFFVILFELTAPFLLFSRFRYWALSLNIVFAVANDYLLHVRFYSWVGIGLALFIEWPLVAVKLAGWRDNFLANFVRKPEHRLRRAGS